MTTKIFEEIIQKKRKYASFFEWPDKQMKEYGVVQILLESMKKQGVVQFTGLRAGPHPNKAPDCIADCITGGAVAIEVTEFVSRKAIEMNQKNKEVYLDWQPDEVISEVKKIISKKDQVNYFGGPYSKTILVIHTDEFVLDHETYTKVLSVPSFDTQTIDEAFFLFSYRPQVETYPYVKLKITSTPLEQTR